MNRSLGTSSLPRSRQKTLLLKFFDVYLGGTGISPTFSPASSCRCKFQVRSHWGAFFETAILVA